MTVDAQEYIAELTRLLYSLPEQEREEAVAFYRESIADRMDDGLTEEEAVASMASPADAARTILSDRAEMIVPACSEEEAGAGGSAGKSTEPAGHASFWARLKRGRFTPLEWVGVVLSSIIWIPLAAAALCVVAAVAVVLLTLYLCVWVLIACVWVVGAALVVAAPANLFFVFLGMQVGNVPYGLVNIGYSLVAFGGGVWILRGALALTKLFLHGHRRIACAIRKKPFVPDEPVSSEKRSGEVMFFRVCLGLLGLGLVSVLAGYILSGFDWHVFISSINGDGSMYLGGTEVDHPESLLFGPLFFVW